MPIVAVTISHMSCLCSALSTSAGILSHLDAIPELCKPVASPQAVLHKFVMILAKVIDLSVQAAQLSLDRCLQCGCMMSWCVTTLGQGQLSSSHGPVCCLLQETRQPKQL